MKFHLFFELKLSKVQITFQSKHLKFSNVPLPPRQTISSAYTLVQGGSIQSSEETPSVAVPQLENSDYFLDVIQHIMEQYDAPEVANAFEEIIIHYQEKQDGPLEWSQILSNAIPLLKTDLGNGFLRVFLHREVSAAHGESLTHTRAIDSMVVKLEAEFQISPSQFCTPNQEHGRFYTHMLCRKDFLLVPIRHGESTANKMKEEKGCCWGCYAEPHPGLTGKSAKMAGRRKAFLRDLIKFRSSQEVGGLFWFIMNEFWSSQMHLDPKPPQQFCKKEKIIPTQNRSTP